MRGFSGCELSGAGWRARWIASLQRHNVKSFIPMVSENIGLDLSTVATSRSPKVRTLYFGHGGPNAAFDAAEGDRRHA